MIKREYDEQNQCMMGCVILVFENLCMKTHHTALLCACSPSSTFSQMSKHTCYTILCKPVHWALCCWSVVVKWSHCGLSVLLTFCCPLMKQFVYWLEKHTWTVHTHTHYCWVLMNHGIDCGAQWISCPSVLDSSPSSRVYLCEYMRQ